MQKYTYEALANIKSTAPQAIFNEDGQAILSLRRVYTNRLKRILDGYFDHRYFLKYEVLDLSDCCLFEVKKIFRRGKVWFEGKDHATGDHFVINYENWRIGVPELFISNQNIKMKIDKEMETWSNFLVDEQVVARWIAVYDEQHNKFQVTLELYEQAPIQNVAFYIAIAQATLFIGV
ncbi:peptide ABC transporter ATPase [Solibacillus sp. R5-41]|uniref:tubby C-terminal domain-like protein n=1 Tax=Solibacillus sp. R5-41 TaxID=2048654 RepID=UPI000C128464|nr:peptide ABC transporter ATPase [Solibacillus sp. R5-41]ATP39766.1 peptide ABC transporter ATPase [Solibacillus sp. R5-41]